MNYNEKIFVGLLSQYINKVKEKTENSENIDWEYITNLADIHNVTGILYAAVKNNGYKLPDKIVSDEYITIEGEKLSKSKGNYISIRSLLKRYPADAIRYYFLINDPEKRDFNFTWDDFINSINGELLGKWGNFINRTLLFVNKSFDGRLKNSTVDKEIEERLNVLFNEAGTNIENGDVKEGINKIFDFIVFANKYFDENQPWVLVKTDKDKCNSVLFNCVNIISNVNTLLKPYLPFSCEKVEEFLNTKISKWEYNTIFNIALSKDIKPLYERYDKSVIVEEKAKLKK